MVTPGTGSAADPVITLLVAWPTVLPPLRFHVYVCSPQGTQDVAQLLPLPLDPDDLPGVPCELGVFGETPARRAGIEEEATVNPGFLQLTLTPTNSSFTLECLPSQLLLCFRDASGTADVRIALLEFLSSTRHWHTV